MCIRDRIKALDQATSNSSDAQNAMKIADGALGEVSSMLQRIRELAVQGLSLIHISSCFVQSLSEKTP